MNEEIESGSTRCRICLRQQTLKYKSLFEKYKNIPLYDHINIIAKIKIKINDGLTDTICSTCFLELETAINFKEKCENTEYILKSTGVLKIAESENSPDLFIKNEMQVDQTDHLSNDSDYEMKLEYVGDVSLKKNGSYSLACLPKLNLGDTNIIPSTSISCEKSFSQVQCHDCGTYFKSKCKLRVHWKKTHLLNSLICSICKMTFKTYKAYHSHKKIKRQSCTAAASGMFSIEGIGKTRTFQCNQCPYKSKKIKDVQTHIVIHSGDRPYQCEMCPKNFTQLSSLQAHKEIVHKKYILEATCEFCGKFLRGRSQVYRHIKTHTGDKVPCPICKKMLSKYCLRAHLQRHSNVKSYTCEICAQSYYTCAELCNHRRYIHSNFRKLYKCDLCEYKANRSDAIKKHRAKHTDQNSPCTICGMFFLSKQKLNLHERIHIDEKKYSCAHCDAKFHRRESVRKHIKVKHKTLVLSNNKVSSVSVKEENHG